MKSHVHIRYILLIFIILTGSLCAWSNVIKHKSNGCTLNYSKIDEYTVEVGKQDATLTLEKIYIPNEIIDEDTTYYVVGIADNAFSGNEYIKKVYFDDNNDIKYIGSGAFAGCINLTEIEIPSMVTEIKPYTFAWCGLKYIEIHNLITRIGDRAFTNCKKLARIDMSENIEEIGNFAFAWCTSLTSFTIPEKTKKIGYDILQANEELDTLFFNAINCEISGAYYDEKVERTIGAFEGNDGLSEIIFGYKVERIPEYLLYNCYSVDTIYFPKSIKQIDRFALHNTSWFDCATTDMIYVNNILYSYKGEKEKITADDFKDNITKISDYCFFNNKKLKQIDLPSSILSIGNSAFEGCKELIEIKLPYDLEQLGDRSFKGCENLKEIKFNSFLEEIGDYCFSGCNNLSKVALPNSVREMGEGVFYDCQILERANIPDSTTYVPAGCFSKCPNLERVGMHKNIKEIGEYAFAGCGMLDSIKIFWDCTKIGSRAFSHCSELQYIDINAKSIRIDPMAFYHCDNLAYIDLTGANRIGYKSFANCKKLNYISVGDNLESISDKAFQKCENLYSIQIPRNVKNIGKNSFDGCKNLVKLTINDASTTIGAYAFNGCKSLKEVSLGYNIIEIGSYAFNNCQELKRIEIKSNLEKIEEGCFQKCKNLETLILPYGLKEVGEKAFEGCIKLQDLTLPNTLQKIKSRGFANCNNIKNIKFSNEIIELGEKVFWNCDNLKKIEIPITLEKIGRLAFGDCDNLTEIIYAAEQCESDGPIFSYNTKMSTLNISNSVQKVDDRIFEGLNIKSITIPENVIYIEKLAFANATNLKDIKISSYEIRIDNSAFDNTAWSLGKGNGVVYIDNIAFEYIGNEKPQNITIKDGTIAIASNFMKNNDLLEEINLPSSIETIGDGAFDGCKNLKEIRFPYNIKHIYNHAFANCQNLKEIKLPSSITTIGECAFENCTKIDSVVIDDAYCQIGVGAFRNCERLKTAKIGKNITEIGNMAFAYCKSLQYMNSEKEFMLPSNIDKIDIATFYNCEKIQGKITIPHKVKEIEERAFNGCRSIHSVELSSKTNIIDNSAFNDAYNFTRFVGTSTDSYSIYEGALYSKDLSIIYYCPQGYNKTFVAHKNAEIVNRRAFTECQKIEHVVLNGVKKIEDFAFNGCYNLKKISLGENFQFFNHNSFEGCQSLEEINIKKSNKKYKTVDGVVYSADMKELVFCPRAKKGIFKIPTSVESIAAYAFYNCNQIEQVVMHKNIKTIGEEAFTGCKIK